MRETRRPWQNILYVFLLLAAVILLFWWYATTNSQRIEASSLNYAMDSARQTALRVSGELINGRRRVHNYAYLLSTTLNEPSISTETLLELENNSDFDALHFTNSSGINLASNGATSNSQDRSYFESAMQGESGSTVLFDSRITNETMIVFHAPLYYEGEIFGALLGLYFAEDYLQEILTTSYFGETADVFLCTQDGRVVASSKPADWGEQQLLDVLVETGVVDAQTAASAWEIFQSGSGQGGFICAPGSLTDNLCVLYVPDSEYLLVQAYPKSVTQAMIQDANQTGMVLQVMLIALFVVYILALLVRGQRVRRRLERENREMGYVINGVSTLFTRFILADLEEGSYCYLAGTTPERDQLASSGQYEDFTTYLLSFLVDEEERRRFQALMDRDSVSRELGAAGTDIQYEYQVRYGDATVWEHINIICLERKEGRACKVLVLRQNITGLKEKELKAKAEEIGYETLSETCGAGAPTLADIVKELSKPGRDPRDELPPPILRTDVMEAKDLKPGMELQGTVRNVIDFGVFVDIGVHQDGLVHISKLPRRVKHPSELLSVGDVITVWVVEVDEKKKRISLTMKKPS